MHAQRKWLSPEFVFSGGLVGEWRQFKRRVYVDAVQIHDPSRTTDSVRWAVPLPFPGDVPWLNDALAMGTVQFRYVPEAEQVIATVLSGDGSAYEGWPGDWIVRRPDGDLFVVTGDEFDANYQPVSEAQAA